MKTKKSEKGNVIVEFIGITVGLLVPISIIANASIVVATAFLSTEIAARTASRAFVVASNDALGKRAANSAAALVANDFNSREPSVSLKVSCTKSPCLSPGGFVTAQVSKTVGLKLPSILGSRKILVSSQHTSVVDELRKQ